MVLLLVLIVVVGAGCVVDGGLVVLLVVGALLLLPLFYLLLLVVVATAVVPALLKQRRSKCSWTASRSDRSERMGAEGMACLILLTIQVGRRLWESLAVTRWGASRMSHLGYVVRTVAARWQKQNKVNKVEYISHIGLIDHLDR